MIRKLLVTLLAGMLWACPVANATGALAAKSYGSIPVRNAFGLHKDFPAQKLITVVKPVPTVEVVLTGISTVGGAKKVLLRVKDKSAGNNREYSPPIAEGGSFENIQVLSVAPEQGSAVVNIRGETKRLTLEKDSEAEPTTKKSSQGR